MTSMDNDTTDELTHIAILLINKCDQEEKEKFIIYLENALEVQDNQ